MKTSTEWRLNKREISEQTFARARGLCEWCGRRLPIGTPAAHIIPRSDPVFTSNEPWNLAALGIVSCQCHTVFDANRAKAVRQMRAEGGCRLLKRIDLDERLRAYFERKEARQAYVERTERMRR